jgi:hypothetical protein
MSVAMRTAGLLIWFAVAPALGQAPAEKKESKPEPSRWTILFAWDDPSEWDKDAKNTKGVQVAIPVKYAPAKTRYLRLRRADTGDGLIIPVTRDDLTNGKPKDSEADFWWNGSSHDEYGGRHLGIAEKPRIKFPAPHGMISVQNTREWHDYEGSGFGHKCFVNDVQYYCWRGKEIKRTVFEIAVAEGPLTEEEKELLPRKR